MNWIESLQSAITYMEDHLFEPVSATDIARYCGYSEGHLQRGFAIVTGYTFAEYLRNRRLYLAALELRDHPKLKIIDAALKYGYESPDAFSRAFRKFHGCNPHQIRSEEASITTFLPLQIHLSVRGGKSMDYQLQNIPEFTVIGKTFTISSEENSFEVIPRMWEEFMTKCIALMNEKDPSAQDDAEKKAIWQNNIGEFGICDDSQSDHMEYLIAGKYRGGEVPEGYVLKTYPAYQWAMFSSLGPVPQSLQKTVTQIFTEWLPSNPDYQLDGEISIEYYPMGDTHALDYQPQVWIPVRAKNDSEK